MTEAAVALARRFFAAVQAGDLDAVEKMYAPDAVGWLNAGGVARSRDEILRVLRWMHHNVTDPRYDDVWCEATETGFVQRHVLHGTGPSGALELAACIVATVVDGRITRMYEYLDSAALAPLQART